MTLQIKLNTGFREDQYQTVDIDEAHKAYYLFTPPEERGIFNNGVAIIGKHIQGIEPDYNAGMGWNPTHKLDSDDWNEINQKGINRKVQDMLEKARDVARLNQNNPSIFLLPLSGINLNDGLPEYLNIQN